jgi:site-specific DNA-adenine methylase
MSKYIFIAFIFLSFNLSAKEEILSTTDNDDNNEVYNLVVNVDDTTQTLKELFKDTYVNGSKIKRDLLNPNDLTTKNGMVLERRDKYNVLNLKSDNFDYDRGGRITIDTLYNGITGERHNYEIELAKDQSEWRIFKDKKSVSKFHVKVNKKIIVGTVGIKTIIME